MRAVIAAGILLGGRDGRRYGGPSAGPRTRLGGGERARRLPHNPQLLFGRGIVGPSIDSTNQVHGCGVALELCSIRDGCRPFAGLPSRLRVVAL